MSAARIRRTPRRGGHLERLLKQNHLHIFSLIHKFDKDVKPDAPCSERDDIIVIFDEAHRMQSGRLARNMRIALPETEFLPGLAAKPILRPRDKRQAVVFAAELL